MQKNDEQEQNARDEMEAARDREHEEKLEAKENHRISILEEDRPTAQDIVGWHYVVAMLAFGLFALIMGYFQFQDFQGGFPQLHRFLLLSILIILAVRVFVVVVLIVVDVDM